jgi:hypothetical protein
MIAKILKKRYEWGLFQDFRGVNTPPSNPPLNACMGVR